MIRLATSGGINVLETVELEAFARLFAAATEPIIADLGLCHACRDSISVFAARNVPTPTMNRAFGIGVLASVTEETLNWALDWGNCHCWPGWAVQVAPLAISPTLVEWLAAQKFEPIGTGCGKFLRRRGFLERHPLRTALTVREIGTEHAADFGKIAATGLGLPSPCAAWFARLVGEPGFRIYLAFDGAQPVASGAMFIDEGWAWLGFGATLPDCRHRGAHSALLARRIADGRAANVRGFATETGMPALGDNQPSFRNILRAGFLPAYARTNYRIPAPST